MLAPINPIEQAKYLEARGGKGDQKELVIQEPMSSITPHTSSLQIQTPTAFSVFEFIYASDSQPVHCSRNPTKGYPQPHIPLRANERKTNG
jgi:hypothetical protein